MRMTLCLLTRNEISGCQHDVPQIQRELFDEVYAIDAGSKDGTLEYLQSVNIPYYIQPKRGYNAACVYAFDKCTTDALVFFHPKGSVPVGDLGKFRAYFEQGYDLVIATRLTQGGHNEEDDRFLKPRKWFVIGMALMSAFLFHREGPIIWDVLHGFRGMSVKGFRQVNPVDDGVSIDLEMVSRSYKKRLKRVEFPTRESPRLAGVTHFKAIPTGWELIKYLVREISRKD